MSLRTPSELCENSSAGLPADVIVQCHIILFTLGHVTHAHGAAGLLGSRMNRTLIPGVCDLRYKSLARDVSRRTRFGTSALDLIEKEHFATVVAYEGNNHAECRVASPGMSLHRFASTEGQTMVAISMEQLRLES